MVNPLITSTTVIRHSEGDTLINDSTLGPFSVPIDYGQSLEEMVIQGGYDYVDEDIRSKNFHITGGGMATANVWLVSFNQIVTRPQILSSIAARGMRPAAFSELLALGAKYPEAQKEFPIIALGSVRRYSRGCRGVPCLEFRGEMRGVGIDRFGGGWNSGCRFAAVNG